jgi:hypothetical protein
MIPLISTYLVIGVLICLVLIVVGSVMNPKAVKILSREGTLLKTLLLLWLAWPWALYKVYKTWGD